MKLSTLKLLFTDSLKNIIRNRQGSISSTVAIISSLLLSAILLLCLLNIRIGILGIYSQFETRITLDKNLSAFDKQNIYNQIRTASAAADIKLENEIVPMYVINVNDSAVSTEINNVLNGIDGIASIISTQKLPAKILFITKSIQLLIFILFPLILVISFFVIKNTIKIALYSRQNEVSIMEYVGASPWYIKSIFIFEGVTVGLLGAITAVIIIYFLYNFLYTGIIPYLKDLPVNFINPSFIYTTILLAFIPVGIIFGAASNYFVVKNMLKV
ncbi:MAG: cell division protein FtsX [Solirubrobacterales bacterium]